MRHLTWQLTGCAFFVALLSVRCAAPERVPLVVKPTQAEVEGASPLIITVTRMHKRPLRPEELTPPAKGGFLWEYHVTIENPTDMTVRLDRVRLSVQNIWGESWPGDQPLNLQIRGGSEGQVPVQARLASSDPKVEWGVTGVETLTFLGQREDGRPISFTIRVPLD